MHENPIDKKFEYGIYKNHPLKSGHVIWRKRKLEESKSIRVKRVLVARLKCVGRRPRARPVNIQEITFQVHVNLRQSVILDRGSVNDHQYILLGN